MIDNLSLNREGESDTGSSNTLRLGTVHVTH